MIEWLKTILGDNYNDEIDKKVATEIGKAFVARTDFNALNEAKKGIEESIKERDKQLDELRKVDPAELQNQIKKLQADNKAAADAYDAQVKQLKTDVLLEAKLIKAGAVNTKAVRALLDQTKIKLDGENLIGVDEQLKTIRETDKWAFGAVVPAGRSGAKQGAPGGTEPGDTVDAEILGALFEKKPQ